MKEAKKREIRRVTRASRIAAWNAKLEGVRGRPCLLCGDPFNPKVLVQKYCSNKCSKRARRRREKSNQRQKQHFIIKERLSNRLRELLAKQGRQKTNGIVHYMGCTPKEMMAHIESQFADGMNWGNYGVSGWHLDHIIPCQRFDLSKEEHCMVCFNWRNIRPLWGRKNWERREMLSLDEALQIDPMLVEMATEIGVALWRARV